MKNKISKNIITFYIIIALASAGLVIFVWKFTGINTQLTADTNNSTLVEEITPKEVRALIDNNEDFYLLDVRDSGEYSRNGHIQGALNIPLKEIETKYIVLPKDKLIVVMCDGNNCRRSSYGIAALYKLGFRNLKNFKSGTAGWKEAGYDLVNGAPPMLPIIISEINCETLKDKMNSENNLFLIDIRSKQEYEAGHIATAQRFEYTNIKQSFRDGKIPPDKELIIYDSTNLRARVAAEELMEINANNIKVLTGGMDEWIARGFQVEE